MARVGVIGSGLVGDALADGFLKIGYEVMRGSRDPHKLDVWKTKAGAKALVGDIAATAKFGDIIVLAVKGTAAESVVKLAKGEDLAGKTIIDTTNPIADAPPENGVIKYFTSLDESLMERLQKAAPNAHFVKAFCSIGNAFMVNPDFGGVKPTMFICGNDDKAKGEVTKILEKFGWEIADMGKVEAARAIEPLAILWCIPGFLKNDWAHAFKFLKK